MGNPFERLFRKKEEPSKPKSMGPNFEELAMFLPDKDEQDELRGFEDFLRTIGAEENEGRMVINHSLMTDEQENRLHGYSVLIKKAQELLDQKKQLED
jgi:hypothetical protein